MASSGSHFRLRSVSPLRFTRAKKITVRLETQGVVVERKAFGHIGFYYAMFSNQFDIHWRVYKMIIVLDKTHLQCVQF